jgi:signal recognition particle subunit SRP54
MMSQMMKQFQGMGDGDMQRMMKQMGGGGGGGLGGMGPFGD